MWKRITLVMVVVAGVGWLAAASAIGPEWEGYSGVSGQKASFANISTATDTPLGEGLSDAKGDVGEGEEPYPPPPRPGTATPRPPAEWVYASASNEEVAETTLSKLVERGWASAGTRVIHVRDYGPSEAVLVGDQPDNVLAGSPVDVAVTLEGEVVSWLPGSWGPPKAYPYAVIIVDRADGSPYSLALYETLQDIPTELR